VNFTNEPNARLIITDYEIITNTALTISLFNDFDADGAVDAGERIAVGDFSANGGIARGLTSGHYCGVGQAPKVLASAAGTVRVVGRGRLIKEG
jgi:hypothetical protein